MDGDPANKRWMYDSSIFCKNITTGSSLSAVPGVLPA